MKCVIQHKNQYGNAFLVQVVMNAFAKFLNKVDIVDEVEDTIN